jgi:hypothetical protein
MADITAKITVRQGAIAQLPRLSPGEFGMATDVNRLFIGSKVHTATGDGSTTEFTFGVDLDKVAEDQAYNLYYIDIDGNDQTYNSDYTVDNFKVTFTTAPANGAVITFTYNSEVMLTTPPEGIIDVPVDVEVSSGALTNQPFPSITIDPARFGSAKIRYSLVSANHRRNGVLDIALDSDVNNITINDNYTQNTGSTLDHEFGKSIVNSQFVLTVTTTETQPVRMTWVEDHFAVATV